MTSWSPEEKTINLPCRQSARSREEHIVRAQPYSSSTPTPTMATWAWCLANDAKNAELKMRDAPRCIHPTWHNKWRELEYFNSSVEWSSVEWNEDQVRVTLSDECRPNPAYVLASLLIYVSGNRFWRLVSWIFERTWKPSNDFVDLKDTLIELMLGGCIQKILFMGISRS